jgi:hypothetical protein
MITESGPRPRIAQFHVGTMPEFSTMRMTVRSGARVRWRTVRGTTNPWPGLSSIVLSFRSIRSLPSTTKKNSSSSSCLCQWYSTLDDAYADDGAIDLAERLIEPFVLAALGHRFDVDELKWAV